MTNQETEERDFYISYIYDEYKSVNGIRPRWIDFNSMSTSALKEMADKLEQEVIASIAEDRKRENKWEAQVWFHRLMVEEARRSPLGVVYPNPDYDEFDGNSFAWGTYNEYKGVVGAEMYHFNKPFTNRISL